MSRSQAPRPGFFARLRAALGRWRRSLQLRVVATSLLLGAATVLGAGFFLTAEIRNGLFEERRVEASTESALGTQEFNDYVNSPDAMNEDAVLNLARQAIETLTNSGSGKREVTLLSPPPGPQGGAQLIPQGSTELATNRLWVPVISSGMRAAVAESDAQQWQSVRLPVSDIMTVGPDGVGSGSVGSAGLVVGSRVTLPVVGSMQLYFIYSLAPEQETLDLIERVLAIGGVGMVVVLTAMTYLITRQVVTPVREAVQGAERLASGLLSERLRVHGAAELASLARSFNEMAAALQSQIERMEELSRMQRRFVSDVSHELRTPLTTVRMAGEMIYDSRGSFPPDLARSAELLAIQIDRFEELLSDLLEISRFDAGAARLESEERDLRDVVARVVAGAEPLALDNRVEVRVYSSLEPCTADIDSRRVERIVRNLLVNAVEHAEGRPVNVHVACTDEAVAVAVRDHGVGMDPDQVAHAFDRFWRADPARARKTGGTGLGLAISAEDAALHGGRLEAWGELGEGTSFRLTLPRRAGMDASRSPLELVPPNPDDSRPDATAVDPADPASLDFVEVDR